MDYHCRYSNCSGFRIGPYRQLRVATREHSVEFQALWLARVHGERPGARLRAADVERVLAAGREVMTAALGQGGTSFDALYVNVNGQSGYFDRSLAAYGQENKPCPRCGSAIIREAFMNRSSFSCPRCQRPPR